MEVCVDSLESALNAFEGGAIRIELCSSLSEGGLTPTYGLFKSIRNHLDKLPDSPEKERFKINCMIRSRPGDFVYTDVEMETMLEDAKKLIEMETDGLVFGALDPNGNIDETLVRDFKSVVPTTVKTTFHRAFDACCDWKAAYEKLTNAEFGFDWLLTSGQEKNAYEGRHLIGELIRMNKSTKIIAGCGINAANLQAILKETNCDEFHASCRMVRPSVMVFKNARVSMGTSGSDEFTISYSSKEKIQELVNIYNRFYNK